MSEGKESLEDAVNRAQSAVVNLYEALSLVCEASCDVDALDLAARAAEHIAQAYRELNWARELIINLRLARARA
jgi:hypothetical protein